MKKIKIGVTGLGLIGGSIFKALKDKYETVAFSKSQKGKNIYDNLDKLKDLDVIFVCNEMSKTLDMLDKLKNVARENTIVSDVCSIKTFLSNKAYPFKFISTHPMAGLEVSGFENSFKELFSGAKWVLAEHNEILENLIKDMGANPVIFQNEEHDNLTAFISHAPAILAFAIFNAVLENKKALSLASSGFRDMTRLCGNPDLACEMLKFNRENIDIALDEIINSLNYLKNLSDDERIVLFKKIAKQRMEMYKNGKNQIIYK